MLYMYIMAEKKVINVRLVKGTTKGKRKARARAKPKEKTRQKQKQKQNVTVNVSGGGSGGGGTSFIPMPQAAPAFDYSLLANLIRPANTVDMPIRAMTPIPEPVQVRPAEVPTLAGAKTGSKAEVAGEFAGIPASFRIKKGESEQDAMVRHQEYLADKRERERERTRLANEMRNIPVARAEAGGRAPVFVGEEDVFGFGEK